MTFNIPAPDLQVAFSIELVNFRKLYLQEALGKTVRTLDISKLNDELTTYVPKEHLSALAEHGLRRELVFPTPYLLQKNPRLLGYYRLLLSLTHDMSGVCNI